LRRRTRGLEPAAAFETLADELMEPVGPRSCGTPASRACSRNSGMRHSRGHGSRVPLCCARPRSADGGLLDRSPCGGQARGSWGLATRPRRAGGRSHGSVRRQRTSTAELRAPRAWSSSLLASGPPLEAKGTDLSRPAEAPSLPGEIIPEWWATSSRNGGRNYLGMAGEIIPESWAASIGIRTGDHWDLRAPR
jgi:hypothetical protein